jgi:hypothetical protein
VRAVLSIPSSGKSWERQQTFRIVGDRDSGDRTVERSNSRVSMAGSGDADLLEQESQCRLLYLGCGVVPSESETRVRGEAFSWGSQKGTGKNTSHARALEASTSECYLGAKRSERARVDNLCEETQNEAPNPDTLTTRLE